MDTLEVLEERLKIANEKVNISNEKIIAILQKQVALGNAVNSILEKQKLAKNLSILKVLAILRLAVLHTSVTKIKKKLDSAIEIASDEIEDAFFS